MQTAVEPGSHKRAFQNAPHLGCALHNVLGQKTKSFALSRRFERQRHIISPGNVYSAAQEKVHILKAQPDLADIKALFTVGQASFQSRSKGLPGPAKEFPSFTGYHCGFTLIGKRHGRVAERQVAEAILRELYLTGNSRILRCACYLYESLQSRLLFNSAQLRKQLVNGQSSDSELTLKIELSISSQCCSPGRLEPDIAGHPLKE